MCAREKYLNFISSSNTSSAPARQLVVIFNALFFLFYTSFHWSLIKHACRSKRVIVVPSRLIDYKCTKHTNTTRVPAERLNVVVFVQLLLLLLLFRRRHCVRIFQRVRRYIIYKRTRQNAGPEQALNGIQRTSGSRDYSCTHVMIYVSVWKNLNKTKRNHTTLRICCLRAV